MELASAELVKNMEIERLKEESEKVRNDR